MRRVLVVGEGPELPLHADVRHVPDTNAAIEAALWPEVILLHSRTADEDVDAVGRLHLHAPIVVLGPTADVVLANEVLLAGADDYLEVAAIERTTLQLAMTCALSRRAARDDEERRRRHEFDAAVKEREIALRRSLIDHLADRLHNPLTVLTLQASILAHRLPEGERGRAKQLLGGTRRMRNIVDSIINAFNAPDTTITRIAPVELTGLLRRSMTDDELGPAWSLAGGSAWVRTDPRMVGEAIEAMLAHAAVTTPPGGRVDVRVDSDSRGASVRVCTPVAAQSDVFEPFCGMDDLATEGGLGLEMYTAHTLARRLGGDIVLQGNGDGCCFVLRLPDSLRAEVQAVQPSAA